MSKRLQQEKQLLVAQSDALRSDLDQECSVLSAGYRSVAERIATAVTLMRMVRLARRITAVLTPRRHGKKADNQAKTR